MGSDVLGKQMKALEGLKEVSTFLKDWGVTDSQKEAELIVSDYIGVGKVTLYRDNPSLTAEQEEKITKVLERRRDREPLQYIIGFVEFYGLKIEVGPGALIPRPETELIVEEAIKAVKNIKENSTLNIQHTTFNILDLCTGTGCLALALAREFRDSIVFGTDMSEETLRYAALNAKNNGIANVTFLQGDLYEPVRGRSFDLIVSNPPYIKRAEISKLAPEIRSWEPLTALDGGEDGLQFYRDILSRAPDYLAPDASLIMELGQGEAFDVIKLAEDAGLRTISLIRDYAGIERVLHVKRS